MSDVDDDIDARLQALLAPTPLSDDGFTVSVMLRLGCEGRTASAAGVDANRALSRLAQRTRTTRRLQRWGSIGAVVCGLAGEADGAA